MEELLARLEVLYRRASSPAAGSPITLEVGELKMDLLTQEVRRKGEVIVLQPREYKLLEYLTRHGGQVVTRAMLQGALYTYFSVTYFGGLNEAIVEELDTLDIIYNGQSVEGVVAYIQEQYRKLAADHIYYLLRDSEGKKVAGELDVAPRTREFSSGWIGFGVAFLRWGQQPDVDFLARRATLGNGFEVMVARKYAEVICESFLLL